MLLTFWQWRLSLFRAFLFSEKSFSCFQGVQPATMGAEACPKIAHPCFQLKWFALFGGCNGAIYVPKSRILVFNLNVLLFWGDATERSMSQNRASLFST